MATKVTLRKGAKGASVIELQKLLNKVLKKSTMKIDGDFGENTKKIVIQFQKDANIVADGIVGKGTWAALAQATLSAVTVPASHYLLSDIAARYIGIKETGDNRIGSSEEMREIFEADDLVVNGETDGYPWCAAFVSLCVQKLCSSSILYGDLIPPRQPSVSRFLNNWAKTNNCLIFKPDSEIFTMMKGDIVVFTFSHIGIVESNNGTSITTIEGNTNDAGSREGTVVARKQRSARIIKSVIRLPMTKMGTDIQLNDSIRYC